METILQSLLSRKISEFVYKNAESVKSKIDFVLQSTNDFKKYWQNHISDINELKFKYNVILAKKELEEALESGFQTEKAYLKYEKTMLNNTYKNTSIDYKYKPYLKIMKDILYREYLNYRVNGVDLSFLQKYKNYFQNIDSKIPSSLPKLFNRIYRIY